MRQIKNGATAEQAAEAIIGITSTITTVEEHTVTHEEATELLEHFEQKGYITSTGKAKDTMKNALKNGTLDLPKKYEAARERFEQIIANADRKPPVRDASRDVVVRLNKQVMLSPEFLELWSKIKQKTAYRVSIDTEQLVKNCVKAFQEMPHIPKTRLVVPDCRYSHPAVRDQPHGTGNADDGDCQRLSGPAGHHHRHQR